HLLKIEQQEAELEKFKNELEIRTKNLLERNRRIQEIKAQMNSMSNAQNSEELDALLKSKILTNQDWDNYKRAFEHVYPQFFKKLGSSFGDLTQGEQRTAALMKLQLTNIEIAEILGISDKSVIQNKYRLRKKLSLEDNSALLSHLDQL
ncbi:MAG: helix-turn-helix transcriptional regulator, partial [Flavobacteriales bacterium]